MRMSSIMRQVLVFVFQLMTVIFLFNLQTIAWPMIFGSMLAPLFWLNIILYLCLYRKPAQSILFIYLIGFLASFFTATSLKMLLLPLLIFFVVIQLVKNRFFWSGFGYFILMSLIGTFVYHLSYLLLSKHFEPHQSQIMFFTRVAQILLTTSVSLPTYWLLSKYDLLLNESYSRSSAEEVIS